MKFQRNIILQNFVTILWRQLAQVLGSRINKIQLRLWVKLAAPAHILIYAKQVFLTIKS
jgi:hypothetical protein